jgi:cytochrome c oxidase subunit 2
MVVLNMKYQARLLAAVLAVTGAAAAASDRALAGARPQAEKVEITAERFAFTPSEVRARVGVPLDIVLSSEDTDHGFQIPEADINVRIPKRHRGSITVTFTAEKPGRYAFQCSHVCGAGHSFMRGTIVVTE